MTRISFTSLALLLVAAISVFVVDQSQAAAIARDKCPVDDIRVQQNFDMEQVGEPGVCLVVFPMHCKFPLIISYDVTRAFAVL